LFLCGVLLTLAINQSKNISVLCQALTIIENIHQCLEKYQADRFSFIIAAVQINVNKAMMFLFILTNNFIGKIAIPYRNKNMYLFLSLVRLRRMNTV
jgi:hypothetical protein